MQARTRIRQRTNGAQNSGDLQNIAKFTGALTIYFQPLEKYQQGDPYSNGLLCQPLWLFRLQQLEENQVLQLLNNCSMDGDEALIVKLINLTASQEYTYNFSDLSLNEKEQLLTLSSNNNCYQKYATSLLITLLIREHDVGNLEIAFQLLTSGGYSGTIAGLNIDVKLNGDKFLLRNTYIELSGAKFSGRVFSNQVLDLSGQHLRGINVERCELNNIKLRWSCLDQSSFDGAKLTGVDLEGASFFNANLNLIAERSFFNNCLLHAIKLDSASFTQCQFLQAEFKNLISNQAMFLQSNLTATTLEATDWKKFSDLDRCRVSDAKFWKTAEGIAIAKKFKLEIITQTPISSTEIQQQFKKIIADEQLAAPNRANSWPEPGDHWQHDNNWNATDDLTQKIYVLKPAEPLYKVLDNYSHLTSDKISYTSKTFEAARAYKAYLNGELGKFCAQEINYGAPRHSGVMASINIQEIMLLHNPHLWKCYQNNKESIRQDLARQKIKQPMYSGPHCQDSNSLNLKSLSMQPVSVPKTTKIQKFIVEPVGMWSRRQQVWSSCG